MKRGFTLIEILIVVAIVAVLSSLVLVGLSSVQKKSRDARRVADLNQVQKAVQLYFQRCGFYPGGTNCSPRSLTPFWSQLRSVLLESDLGILNIPATNPAGRSYGYFRINSESQFVMQAQLDESGSPLLASDIDGQFGTVNCDDEPVPYYCVGL